MRLEPRRKAAYLKNAGGKRRQGKKVAIKGEKFDGHNFILDAISRNAGGVLIQ